MPKCYSLRFTFTWQMYYFFHERKNFPFPKFLLSLRKYFVHNEYSNL